MVGFALQLVTLAASTAASIEQCCGVCPSLRLYVLSFFQRDYIAVLQCCQCIFQAFCLIYFFICSFSMQYSKIQCNPQRYKTTDELKSKSSHLRLYRPCTLIQRCRQTDSNMSSYNVHLWLRCYTHTHTHAHTHTHTFNGPISETTRVSWCQKGKTNLDFTEARDSEWQY